MKLTLVTKSVVAAAAGLLLASCGGGGGGGSSQGSLQLTGTAATGAALANADVQVKCAGGGTGSATTTTAGGYTVSISGGTLPCIIKVTGTSNGVAVSLHSVAETGTAGANGNTSATANVTPVTEMIVAQLLAAMPNDAFANFNPQQVTQAAVASAATAIIDALKAAGVDLSGIDPLKATLVPATSTTAGNAYDKLLDLLGDEVGPESLPLVVNQIATAATTSSTAGLTNAMAAVSGGALEGCPVAVSGKYRTIEYTGGTHVHTVDFKAMTWTTEGQSSQPIVASSQACEFSVGTAKVTIGPMGAGAFQESDMAGYVFPVQSHPLSSVAKTWNFLESGLNEYNQGEHFFGKFNIKADGAVEVCEYNAMNGPTNFGACVPETEAVSVAVASDGSFNVVYGSDIAKAYGYRGPNGLLSLFGTSNPSGDSSPTAFRTHFLLTQPEVLVLPAVGEVTKYWDMEVAFTTALAGTSRTDSNTVTAVDSAAGTFTRQRASDSRVDTWRVNYPVDGLRFRAASTGVSSVYQMQMPSLGMAAVIDNTPGHFYSISLRRP